nr:hypothetical protein [Kibdelosporangium sp. MJ126-NF4]CTQ93802.1 hypothetical protein [Kibdelosporangium sp. MJ126-NF4]
MLWRARPTASLGSPIIGDPTILPVQDHFETIAGPRRTHQIGYWHARMECDSRQRRPPLSASHPRWRCATGVAARRRHKRCRGLEREEKAACRPQNSGRTLSREAVQPPLRRNRPQNR